MSIYDICELILEFDLEVKYDSFCYKVLEKANSNINFINIAKTNPKLEGKCTCILTLFKETGINAIQYNPIYEHYSELSIREYVLFVKLKERGYDLKFNEHAYSLNNLFAFLDDKRKIIIPKLSSIEKESILKQWNKIIDTDSKFLIALKNNLLWAEDINIDLSKLNSINLLILDNGLRK